MFRSLRKPGVRRRRLLRLWRQGRELRSQAELWGCVDESAERIGDVMLRCLEDRESSSPYEDCLGRLSSQ
jgi:hypothetical protein